MKKIASILFLVLAVVFTTDAQQKRKRMKREQMTPEQQTTLAVKKMALALELSEAQQRKVKPILLAEMTARAAARKQMQQARKNQEKASAKKRFETANAHLDRQLAFQKKMKSILNAEQFEKFRKMQARRKMAGKKRMEMRRKKIAWKKKEAEKKKWEEENKN